MNNFLQRLREDWFPVGKGFLRSISEPPSGILRKIKTSPKHTPIPSLSGSSY